LGALSQEELKIADDEASAAGENAQIFLIITAVVSTLLAIAAALWISLQTAWSLAKVRSVADAVAIGDLDQRVQIKSNDEIKDVVDAFNKMTENLRATAQLADRISDGDLTVQPKAFVRQGYVGLGSGTHGGTLTGNRLRCRIGRQQCVFGQPGNVRKRRAIVARRDGASCSGGKKRLLRWSRWPRTSSKMPRMPLRPRRSHASPPRMQKQAATLSAAP
jgi:methyl-accepting chemotaxis protein